MKSRVILLILLLPALLIAAGVGAWTWLWHTESGARWAFAQGVSAAAQSPRSAHLEAQVEGTLKRGLELTDIEYRDADVTVTAERADLAGGVGFSPVVITINRAHVRGVVVMVHDKDPGESDEPFPAADLDLSLPWPIVVRQLQVDGATIHAGDSTTLIDSLATSAKWFENLELEVSRLEMAELTAAASLNFELRAPLGVNGDLRIERFELPASTRESVPWLPPRFAADASVAGDARALDFTGELSWPDWMPTASFEARLDAPLQDLAWAIKLESPTAAIPEELVASRLEAVTLEATGNIETVHQWSARGGFELRSGQWPEARGDFTAEGGGDLVRGTVNAPDLFGGALTVSGEIDTAGSMPFDATITARGLQTGPVLEAFTPHLEAGQGDGAESIRQALQADAFDATVHAGGTLNPLALEAAIENLQGRILGRDMTATGSVTYSDGALTAEALTVRSGESQIVADGSLTGKPGVDLQLDIADLGDFLPDATGRLSGAAQYTHDAERGFTGGQLRADLKGTGLNAFEWQLGEIQVGPLEPGALPAGTGVPANPPLALTVTARQVDGPAGPIEALTAHFAGDFDRQALKISLQTRDSVLEAALSGGPDASGQTTWAGQLQDFSIVPPRGPTWSLREPAELHYEDGVRIETACLAADASSGVCADATFGADGSKQGSARLENLSPELFGALAGGRLSFSQRLNGEVSWSQPPGEALSASAAIDITAGEIVDEAEDLDLLKTQQGALRFTLDAGSVTAGTIDIPFASGMIDVDFSVPDILNGSDPELRGRIRVQANDLRALSGFTAQLAQTAGTLTADVRLSGTATEPRLNGEIALRNASAHVVSPGLRLEDMELVATLEGNNRLRVDGRFTAGEGEGLLEATARFADPARPTFEARLTGTGLTLVDVPDLRLQADTDVTGLWNGDALELSGNIHVTDARFAPAYLPSDTASESPDVVIVSGGEVLEAKEPNEPVFDIRGQLEVSMGEDVVIDLDLARATMTGSVTFAWQGAHMPSASGEYDLEGKIQAYGQQLEITRATIRYPGVPANNPHLDIRGERRIYGNSMITRAGVYVHGTLKRPITEPYTVPGTNADRARALLITGSDFDYEQGVGAVNVGTYIAPKLYLSYGVGLFEEGNVISARYELKSNFGVKATSGQDETGIDFSYTIER